MSWSNTVLHTPLQEKVITFIEQYGGECFDTTIHKLNPEISRKIRNHPYPASKALAARADLFVIPQHKPTFYIDFKTSFTYKLKTWDKYQAMVYEALQISKHKGEYRDNGTQCMYIAQDKDGIEGAFWVHEMSVWELLRPSNTGYDLILQQRMIDFFTNDTIKLRDVGPIKYIDKYGGLSSGDMMVTFTPDNKFYQWETLLHHAL